MLARLFARPANVLVLDEPTNDLDIDTLELLESLLQEFSGTLFLVSHDRAFLENTVTQLIAFEGNGKLTEFGGGYDDWQRFTSQRQTEEKASEKTSNKKSEKTATAPSVKPAEKNSKKLSFKEQKELEAIPGQIEALETEQTDIQTQLSDGELYKKSPEKIKPLQDRSAEIEDLLLQLMERWELLEQKAN